MTVTGDHEPGIGRQGPRRRRLGHDVNIEPTPAFPGLVFRPTFPGGRKALVNLSRFPRESLALEAAETIWRDWREQKAYASEGAMAFVTQALARFGDFLPMHDPEGRISSLRHLTEADVDSFDIWLHDVAFKSGSVSPYPKMSGFVVFLKRALKRGLTRPELAERLRYVSKYHDAVDCEPRDAYDPLTMANLRRAAQRDVVDILARLRKGRRLMRQGDDPFFVGGWNRPANLMWSLAVHGMPLEKDFKRLKDIYWRDRIAGRHELTAPRLLDMRYLSHENCVPFLILLADATGLPIECIHELKADCLVEPYAESGFSELRYVKRRQTRSERMQRLSFALREPFSAGWLVHRLLYATAPARRDLGMEDHEGSLFLGRVGLRVQEIQIGWNATMAWLKQHPIVCDSDGGTLQVIQLSRIRKSWKADAYVATGGDLAKVRKDHSLQVFADHYARIPFLDRRHDDAIAAGLQEAHDAAMLPHVFGGPDAERLADDPATVARAIGVSEERAREVLSGSHDSWTAGCLDFLDSQFAERGKPCGAPVFGCLDCRNAVITSEKLPALIRLSRHVEGKRQQMRLDDWKRNYGFVFVRLRQIFELFPETVLARAREAAAVESGRDWTFAQLAYRMEGDR